MLVRMGVKSMAGIHTDFPVRTRRSKDRIDESGGGSFPLRASDVNHVQPIQVRSLVCTIKTKPVGKAVKDDLRCTLSSAGAQPSSEAPA